MKFIHTSDWHLGRQLHNQSLLDDQAIVLAQIISLAVEHKVDAVVIAGDIYDRSIPPANAVALLDDVVNQLVAQHNIQVVMIAGNHDGHERLGFGAKQMAESGLHITGPLTTKLAPVKLVGASGDVWCYSLPYADPATVRQVFEADAAASDIDSHQAAMQILLKQVHEHDSGGLPKLVVSHCFLDGGSESESERPLSIGGADKIAPALFSDFDYVALGHLHGPQYKGAEHVRYSGSILKYSFSEEKQRKSVTLVDLAPGQAAKIQLLPLTARRDVRILEGEMDALLSQGIQDPNCDDYIMIRLLDTHAILDAIGKLRCVYPNILHLERTGLMAKNQQLAIGREHIKKGEMAMFTDFFSQVSGEPLSQLQQAAMTTLLDELHQGEER